MAHPEADIVSHAHNRVSVIGHYERGRWCVSYRTVREWLPPGTTREQAEWFLDLVPKIFDRGYETAQIAIRAALGLKESS